MINDMENENNVSKDSEMVNIIQNLQNIEQLASKNDLNEEEFKELEKIIMTCMDWGYNEIKKNDSDTSLQIFELLDYFDQKMNFKEIFENYNFSLINNINIATCYQMSWNLEKNYTYLENTYNLLVEIIKKEKNQNNYQNFLNQMKYLFLLSKVCLQIAAVTSQLSKHEESYNWDIKSFKSLKKICKLIKILLKIKNSKEKLPFEINDKQLQYFKELYKENENVCKGFFILSDEIEFQYKELIQNNNNQQIPNKMINKNDFKEFNKISTEWIEYFNIGNIMHLEPVSFDKIDQEFYFEDFLNEDFFAVLVLVVGCCLFSIATEKRFTMNEKNNDTKKIFNHLKGNDNLSFKNQFNPEFLQSQFFHNKSIEIIENLVDNNDLLRHLKNSFKKNYNKIQLEEIKEEDEFNLSTTTKNEEYNFLDKNNTLTMNNIDEKLLKSDITMNALKQSIENIKGNLLEKSIKKFNNNDEFDNNLINIPKKIKENLNFKDKKKSKGIQINKCEIDLDKLKKKINQKTPKPMIYNFSKKKIPTKIKIKNKSKLNSSKKSMKSVSKNKKNSEKKMKSSKKNLELKKNNTWVNKMNVLIKKSNNSNNKSNSFKKKNYLMNFPDDSKLAIKKEEILKLKLGKNNSNKLINNKTFLSKKVENSIRLNGESLKIKSFYNKPNISNVSWKEAFRNNNNSSIKKMEKTYTERLMKYSSKDKSNDKSSKKIKESKSKNKNFKKLIKNVYKGNNKKEDIFIKIKKNSNSGIKKIKSKNKIKIKP